MAIPVLESEAITDLTSSGTSVSVTPASGIVDGDIILIWCALDGNPNTFASTGFDLIIEGTNDTFGGTPSIALLIKRANSESGNYTVTWDSSEQGRFKCQRISGCRVGGLQLDVVDVIGIFSVDDDTNQTIFNLTSTEIDTLCLSGCVVDRNRVDSGDIASTNSWTTAGVSGSSGGSGGAGLICGEKDLASIGGAGNCLFSEWASDSSIAGMINLGSVEPPASTAQFINMNDEDMG